jgi:hypothetical protein
MLYDYRMQHRPASPDYGAPLYDLTHEGFYPEDVYSQQGAQYFGTKFDDQFIHSLILAARGNPNYPVKIYRTVPVGVEATINPGDWVTPSLKYAQHMQESWQPGGEQGSQIIEMTVPASHIYTDANSWDEWGYWPS